MWLRLGTACPNRASQPPDTTAAVSPSSAMGPLHCAAMHAWAQKALTPSETFWYFTFAWACVNGLVSGIFQDTLVLSQVKGFLHIFFSINSWTVGWLASTVSIYSWSTSRSFLLLDILINCTSQMCSLPYPPQKQGHSYSHGEGVMISTHSRSQAEFWETLTPSPVICRTHTYVYICIYIGIHMYLNINS